MRGRGRMAPSRTAIRARSVQHAEVSALTARLKGGLESWIWHRPLLAMPCRAGAGDLIRLCPRARTYGVGTGQRAVELGFSFSFLDSFGKGIGPMGAILRVVPSVTS